MIGVYRRKHGSGFWFRVGSDFQFSLVKFAYLTKQSDISGFAMGAIFGFVEDEVSIWI